MHAKKFQS
jgi:hypothetical protein